MIMVEPISLRGLSLGEQVEAADRACQLNPTAQDKRKNILQRLYVSLNEADSIIFEETMADSRRLEVNA